MSEDSEKNVKYFIRISHGLDVEMIFWIIRLNKIIKINFTRVSLFTFLTKLQEKELSPLSGCRRFSPLWWRQPGQLFLKNSQSARAGLRHSWGGLTLSGAQDQRVFLFAFLNSVFSVPWRARGCDVTV